MATYSLPNSADCCGSDGILKCPDTLCGDCDGCAPLDCVVPVYQPSSFTTIYDTYIATNPDGTFARDYSGECLHILIPRPYPGPNDTNINNQPPDALILPTSQIINADPAFCDNYIDCEVEPNDPSCWCYPEGDYLWLSQYVVNWEYYSYDPMNMYHTPAASGNLPWNNSMCSYSDGIIYALYFESGTWSFTDDMGLVYALWAGTSKFTENGNDPLSSSYYEIS